MMGLARFAMKSQLNAGVLAAGFAALPLLYALGAALVALVTLRRGATEGTKVLLWSLAGGLISWQWTGMVLPLLVLPVTALLAMVMRSVQNWPVLLSVAALMGIALALAAQGLLNDRFEAVITQVQLGVAGTDTTQPLWQMLESVKPNAAFLVMTVELLEALLCLVLARYWQAGLYNPGGFRQEFHTLRISGRLLIALVLLAGLAYAVKPAAMLLLLLPLLFAGVALVHGVIAKTNMGGQWLIAFYVGGLLLNQFILPLLVLGAVVDGVFDIRTRLRKAPDRNDE
ncbi:hypothetical protein [Saccharospirillum impatiens]|uniref:hypothetical protein n=1 Tax=Saccharospirillum impatiens TaxID=169438 RepID=UPI000408B54B|nr:hypothetical protein [Saccharospirillum impatiens]